MSKRKSTSNANTNATYDSDGGFVEDAPRSKKAKKGTSAASAVNDGGSNGKGEGKGGDMKMNKKKKGAAGGREAGKEVGMEVVGGGQVGRDGEEFWELTSKRRVGITEFKGTIMINIREYYEKDGEALPGKKGIALPLEQFNALIKLLPHIETVLAEKGQSIERPDYSGASASAAVDEEDDEDNEDDEDEEVGKKGKKNFEETSDEE